MLNTSTLLYYQFKPFLPRPFQILLRRMVVFHKLKNNTNNWPISTTAAAAPPGWTGWPDQKQFAFVLTHDVDTAKGHDRCYALMEIEEQLGFRSSFNFVPERYEVSSKLRQDLTQRGFEVGVHGLNHDGKLFKTHKIFTERAKKINQYLKDWNAIGFRAPAMHHNLEWIHELDIEYDLSTFDTDPFEPQSDGVDSIFPFWVNKNGAQKGFVELPYNLVQDFTLFVLMRQRHIDLWKIKLDWIVDHGGMALMTTHPDYMQFNGLKPNFEEYPFKYYQDFLQYVNTRYKNIMWHVLPKDIAKFWLSSLNS